MTYLRSRSINELLRCVECGGLSWYVGETGEKARAVIEKDKVCLMVMLIPRNTYDLLIFAVIVYMFRLIERAMSSEHLRSDEWEDMRFHINLLIIKLFDIIK